jgi:hypothetical protein
MPDPDQSQEFSYTSWRLLFQLAVLGFGAALVLVAAANRPSSGSAVSKLLLGAVAVWGLLYVIRRLKSPRSFVVDHSTVRTGYWFGPEKSWRRDNLSVKPSSPASFWESSTVVKLSSGAEAFRVYRDLPGFNRLSKVLRGETS